MVLRYLDSLLDVSKLDSYDSVLGDSVHGGRGSVLGGDSVGESMGRVGILVSFVLDLVLKDDVLDLLEEVRVDVVALGGLMSDGDRGVVSAVAQGAPGEDGGGVRVA